jgi:hypothetical protein
VYHFPSIILSFFVTTRLLAARPKVRSLYYGIYEILHHSRDLKLYHIALPVVLQNVYRSNIFLWEKEMNQSEINLNLIKNEGCS